MEPIRLQEFSKASKSDWNAFATSQLKGEDPKKALSWQIEGIDLGPYYDAADTQEADYVSEFFSKVRFPWKLYEKIAVLDEALANEQALEALAGGCDGIIFQLTEDPNYEILLKDILTDICDINILSSGNQQNYKDSDIKFSGFNTANTYNISQYEAQLEGILNCLNGLKSEGHIIRTASPDFFLEIAAIRALRFLLSDHLEKDAFDIQVHTLIPSHSEPEHQWFLNATAGLASIVGGTNSVCFTTAVGQSRISRNVGNLIREESGISEYTDPCNGSYFVELLTHRIISACKSRLN